MTGEKMNFINQEVWENAKIEVPGNTKLVIEIGKNTPQEVVHKLIMLTNIIKAMAEGVSEDGLIGFREPSDSKAEYIYPNAHLNLDNKELFTCQSFLLGMKVENDKDYKTAYVEVLPELAALFSTGKTIDEIMEEYYNSHFKTAGAEEAAE